MSSMKYVNGQWYDKHTGEVINPPCKLDLSKPIRLVSHADYEAYECPVTGRMIEGKDAHRENLRRTGCRVLEPGEFEDVKKNGKSRLNENIDKAVDKAVDEIAKDFI